MFTLYLRICDMIDKLQCKQTWVNSEEGIAFAKLLFIIIRWLEESRDFRKFRKSKFVWDRVETKENCACVLNVNVYAWQTIFYHPHSLLLSLISLSTLILQPPAMPQTHYYYIP